MARIRPAEDDSFEKGILRNGKAFSGVFERIFQKYGREFEAKEVGGEVLDLENDDIDALFSESDLTSPRPRHINLDLSVVDDEEKDPDPELTAVLHKKVVQAKQEINWDEKEKQHLEKIRQKETQTYNSLDESDSDPGEAVVSASAPLYREKHSKLLKSTRLPYMVKLKSSPARLKQNRGQIGHLSGFTETESDRESFLGSETLGETEFEGERIAAMSALEGNTPEAISTATEPFCDLDTPLQTSHPIACIGECCDLQSSCEDTPLQTSHPIACISDCCDLQSGYESGNENEETTSDIESDSYKHIKQIHLERSVTPLIDSDEGTILIDSDSCDPEMSVITQNSFPESVPENTKKSEQFVGQVFLKKVIQLKIPKLPISTSICTECTKSHTSYSQAEFGYEQHHTVCSSGPVMDHVHWNSLLTDSNPLVSSPLQINVPVAFQSAQTLSHSSCGDCSCDSPCSQPNTSQCHHPSQHEDGNLFTNHVNVNPSATCTCCTRPGTIVQHLTPHVCHLPCYSYPCDLQPRAPSLPNYYYHCRSVVSSSSDIGISLPKRKSSKRPLELDKCDATDSTVANGPQSKRLRSIVHTQNAFHA